MPPPGRSNGWGGIFLVIQMSFLAVDGSPVVLEMKKASSSTMQG